MTPDPAEQLTVVHLYPFFNRLGGVEKYLLDSLPHQKARHKLLLIGASFDEEVKRDYPTEQIPFLSLPGFLSSFSFALNAQRTLGRLRRAHRVDPARTLTHAQGANCFRQDIVTAHSCHKAWFLRSLREQKMFSWPWIRKLLNPAHHITIATETIQYHPRNHRRVIAISNCIKSELIEYFGIAEDRISVVHSGVDCQAYDPANRPRYRSSIRARHQIPESATLLCFVANEFRRKGLTTILQAMAAAGDRNLYLLAAGRDNPAPFKAIISSLGLESRVIFTGPVRSINEYYAASDVFVFPTLYEPFGLVITEAMASGLAVITSKLAGAAELMHDGVDGILLQDPRDVTELTRALQLVANPERRKSLGTEARASALRHQWGEVVRRIEDIYQEVVPGTARAPVTGFTSAVTRQV